MAVHGRSGSRLGTRDHVTITLLRYTVDGRVVFAGAHEEMILVRRKREAVELVPTPGAWLGARVYHALSDKNFRDLVLGLLFLSGIGLVWSNLH